MNLDKIKKNFDDYGYVTIKNFLNDQEIDKLRSFMIEYDQTKNDKNDFILKTEIGKEILKRTINFTNMLFKKEYHYTGESSFSYDDINSARVWHRDSKATNFAKLDYKQNDILRFMFYFQDHEAYSYGTKYIPGSNKRTLYRFWDYKFYLNPLRNLPSEVKAMLKGIKINNFKLCNLLPVNIFNSHNPNVKAGDMNFWSLRTVHAGNFIRIKYFKNLSFPIFIEEIIKLPFLNKLILKENKKRVVMGFSLGLNNLQTKNYIKQRISVNAIPSKYEEK